MTTDIYFLNLTSSKSNIIQHHLVVHEKLSKYPFQQTIQAFQHLGSVGLIDNEQKVCDHLLSKINNKDNVFMQCNVTRIKYVLVKRLLE